MTAEPKRHHYVPQFFLKFFSVDGHRLWVYDRAVKQFRFQDTKKIGSENKFYTYTVNEKEENLEGLLGLIESMAKPILEKIFIKETISDQEKADLAMFIAILHVRVPEFKKQTEESSEKLYKKINQMTFSDRDRVENMMKRSGKKYTKEEIDDLMEFATSENRYSVKFPSNYWLGTMLKLSMDAARIFNLSDWEIFHIGRKYALVTCDNPLVLVPPKNYEKFFGYG